MFDASKHKKILSLLLVTAAVLLGAFHVADAAEEASSSELKSQLESLENEKDAIDSMLKDLENQYSSNRNELSAMVAEKENIDQQIFLFHRQDKIALLLLVHSFHFANCISWFLNPRRIVATLIFSFLNQQFLEVTFD